MIEDENEYLKMGRLIGDVKAEIELVSGRIGLGGWRTFHCDFSSVKVSGGVKAIDYLARAGDFENKDEDLEHLSGDADKLKEAIKEIDNSARIRKGTQAERILIKQTFELPAKSNHQQKKNTADAIVKYWQEKNHLAIAAVHGNGKVQPHIHVAVTSRPVKNHNNSFIVDRSPDKRPLVGKQAVRNERKVIAKIINENCKSKFHPGRLSDTGIHRKAKRRIPQRAFHINHVRENNFSQYEQLHLKHETNRLEAHKTSEQKKFRKEIREMHRNRKKELYTKDMVAQKVSYQEQMFIRQPRPLNENQRALFESAGLKLPSDIDSNAHAQSIAWQHLREVTKQKKKREAEKVKKDKEKALKSEIANLDKQITDTKSTETAKPKPPKRLFKRKRGPEL
ncbi:hypothetical protein [Curvivirga aplysinae]|uniref:hypothetical protein n=1 Tax=Curvivirga aplysinae TaxID=2529852 RepID=UPI0012BD3B89|nr:hypothetical protein [Curvivirga aplysinae]MTI08331.1 hypothetical protein [Curvivirga aplysinae]